MSEAARARARLSSALLTARITGRLSARTACAISRSPGTSPSRPSTRNTTKSAVCIARRPCSTTIEWRGSVVAPKRPPVSDSMNWWVSHWAGAETMSRVVPATGATIDRRVPVIRLTSVDFPTFGRPTRTTLGPTPCLDILRLVYSHS